MFTTVITHYLFHYFSFTLHNKLFGFDLKSKLNESFCFYLFYLKQYCFFSFKDNTLSNNMLSSQELLNKFSVEVLKNNFQYNYTSMTVSILVKKKYIYMYIIIISISSMDFKTLKNYRKTYLK